MAATLYFAPNLTWNRLMAEPNPIADMLRRRPYLIADGAMGTSLFARGLVSGDAPEFWNLTYPERVRDVHREFVDAGSDILLTNSFGGNAFRLKLHRAEDQAFALAQAAASLARQVADAAPRPMLVAGAIGPSGELFEPVGIVSFEEGRDAFAEQARGLKAGGADVIWIETMSSREEARAAVAGAAATGLAIVATMTFDTAGKTMMGVDPEDAYHFACGLDHPPMAHGANCGLGPTENMLSIARMGAVASPGTIMIAKANCGIPEFSDGEFSYTGTPELMAKYARVARDLGARIIGGCCGSTGVHIKAIRQALEGYQPGPRPDREAIIGILGPVQTIGGARATHGDVLVPPEGRRAHRRRRRKS